MFADASSKAYGAAVYTVDITHTRSNLLISKARVAPCKEGRLTIPKLELKHPSLGPDSLSICLIFISLRPFTYGQIVK